MNIKLILKVYFNMILNIKHKLQETNSVNNIKLKHKT